MRKVKPSSTKLNRRAFFLALYCAGGFILLTGSVTALDPIIYRAMGESLEPYPLGYSVLLLSIFLFILVYKVNISNKQYLSRNIAIDKGLLTFLTCTMFFGITLLNFTQKPRSPFMSIHANILANGIIIAGVALIISMVNNYEPNFFFLKKESNKYFKLEVLKIMRDDFWKSISTLSIVFMGILFGTLYSMINSVEIFGAAAGTIIAVLISIYGLYYVGGLGLGTIPSLLSYIGQVEDKIKKL